MIDNDDLPPLLLLAAQDLLRVAAAIEGEDQSLRALAAQPLEGWVVGPVALLEPVGNGIDALAPPSAPCLYQQRRRAGSVDIVVGDDADLLARAQRREKTFRSPCPCRRAGKDRERGRRPWDTKPLEAAASQRRAGRADVPSADRDHPQPARLRNAVQNRSCRGESANASALQKASIRCNIYAVLDRGKRARTVSMRLLASCMSNEWTAIPSSSKRTPSSNVPSVTPLAANMTSPLTRSSRL